MSLLDAMASVTGAARYEQIPRKAWAVSRPELAVAPFDALAQGTPLRRLALHPDYGPLRPVLDGTTGLPLLLLPRGFEYHSFGWVGEALSDGFPTPPAHDAMAAFDAGEGRIRLVRNHEIGGPFGVRRVSGATYDLAAGGGTTTLELDAASGRVLRSWASLSGTARNCAGGPTPWGSWLSCEQSLDDPRSPASRLLRRHGYVFEVPAGGVSSGRPFAALGRMRHEAIAVDPATGILYETEGESTAGFYRFVPSAAGRLELGGRLEMLAVRGQPGIDLSRGQQPGARFAAAWVPIASPDPVDAQERGVFRQGLAKGGAIFAQLGSVWHGGGCVYFSSTTGGDAELGQVWCFDPQAQELELLFESADPAELSHPESVAASPRGGLLLCEDTDQPTRIQGLSPAGEIFPFAQNNLILDELGGELLRPVIESRYGVRVPPGASRIFMRALLLALGNPRADFRDEEFSGACFGPGGWLFFNIQSPGVSFAVRGPFERGPL